MEPTNTSLTLYRVKTGKRIPVYCMLADKLSEVLTGLHITQTGPGHDMHRHCWQGGVRLISSIHQGVESGRDLVWKTLFPPLPSSSSPRTLWMATATSGALEAERKAKVVPNLFRSVFPISSPSLHYPPQPLGTHSNS